MRFIWLERFEARAQRLFEHGGGMNNGGGSGGSKGDKDKKGGSFAGSAGAGTQAYGHQAAITQGSTGQNMTQAGKNNRQAGKGESPGGGTTTTNQYSPGATGNYPDANAAAVVDQMAQALPGYGAYSTAYKGYKAATDEDVDLSKPMNGPLGDMLGADPGLQRGWQPDRYKGKANMTGVGDPGSASGMASDEREIVGRPLRAAPSKGSDSESEETASRSGTVSDIYSDVMLKDRRKPSTSLKQMLETML